MITHIIMWVLKKARQNFCWHDYKYMPSHITGTPGYYECKKCGRLSYSGLDD
jgi:hypothetical protein|nr:MAG TPA: zinc-ribbon domain protein [Caudoviricetes sp.]